MTLSVFSQAGLVALAQVLVIDIVLAGDNAVVIGMAATRVPLAMRRKVILAGLAAAVILRLGMAAVAVKLMQIIGLTLAGGILLLWVSWRFWRDIREPGDAHGEAQQAAGIGRAILSIVVADISMSLDNVLAVAGAARDHFEVLVIGLLLSVALMGVAAEFIARLLARYRWISYLGLLVIVYVSLSMIWSGSQAVTQALMKL